MFTVRRFVLCLTVIVLFGVGCAPTARQPAVTPPTAERTVRAPVLAATSTPEAPPVTKPEMVAVLPPLLDWPTWHGTWFDVKYPPGFAMRAGAADSAFFSSPDGKVEFYVYSPLWGGDAAADVGLKSATERLVNEKTQVDGPKTTHWVTIAAKDGSYTRSWVDIKDDNSGSPVNHAFGITYKDAASYAGWREAYLAFKASLVQYAD